MERMEGAAAADILAAWRAALLAVVTGATSAAARASLVYVLDAGE